ncbi:hypothetical protein BDV25DRAFT_167777 [Aspergillus avenaceus]|uniref:histidine kinase n=1 Tax=Aspergillus avenaceus TaxID=36643 RepID=A0A5N6U647_ASPAV|nr:hypothetical protein BDV25DRAFT_167777 [Aspergillus avenaceus]
MDSDRGREGGPRKYAYNREGAREREVHLYLPYWSFSGSEKYAQQSIGDYPNVSRDNVLTVFAQLAAVRMQAQRAFISIFDKKMQHVVAEATPHLGLRAPKGKDRAGGDLWLGVRRLPRRKVAMCYHGMDSFVEDGNDIFVINDLTRDERFNTQSSVMGYPHNRFYVSVPIKSPDSYIIGTVAVLDDKPRDGISEEHETFLKELSSTVMDHLLAQRAMREEYREEKMMQTDNQERNLETDDQYNADKDISPIHKFGKEQEESIAGNVEADGKQTKKQRPRLSPTTSQLQESIAPSHVRSVVNRAAAMIYQALDVEGAMFIDASVHARRQKLGPNETHSDKPEEYNVENQEESKRGEANIPSASHPQSDITASPCDNDEEARSLVLGHFTSSASGQGGNVQDSHYLSLSGAFVNHLIEQYPQGKIFHIEEDGSIALSYEGLADEISYGPTGGRGAQTSQAQKKDIQQETVDIKQLMGVLPDARCIAIYPVWDFQRGRWFTVCLVWANDPGRVLSEPKDLTYMAAFSNTVMAEVSRLDLEAADRAKGDFISSISHELRSPLHGLLGTVELLQEMVNSYAQRSLIETVYSCGRTLLDTLNHLLDYAKINTLTRPRNSDKSGGEKTTDVSGAKSAVPGSPQDEDLSVLVQEVIEGLLAGAEYNRREPTKDTSASASNKDYQKDLGAQLMTIVDIEWQHSWQFSVYAGAWRRVVMNLFGNALKYTNTGYIRLLMQRDTLTKNGQSPVPAVRITISDSGRGMSQDFLIHHLYSAFLQEDNTSPGLGVGLHLVHQIVRSLDGQIKFNSEVDRGTQVDVILPVTQPEQSIPSPSPYAPLKDKLNGMTISLFTRSSQLGDLGFDSRVFDDILTNLGNMTSGWFGLHVLTPEQLGNEQPDFVIVTEHEYRNYYQQGSNVPVEGSTEIRPSYPLIVLSARTSSWKTLGESVDDSVIFLTQPVSPKTLAVAFEHCLSQPELRKSSSPKQPTSPERPVPGQTVVDSEQSDTGSKAIENKGAEKTVNGVTDGRGTANGVAVNGDMKPSKNVLFVEDNQVNLKIIEMCVKGTGFNYETANNGLDALEKFKSGCYGYALPPAFYEAPGLTFIDISMPVMDGMEATREMRRFERGKKRPPAIIIILTAALSASMQHETMMSGADMFLTKPTPLKQLKAILKDLENGKKVAQK